MGRSAVTIPEIRACCAVSGRANLLLFAWFRDIQDLQALEQLLVERLGHITIIDRAACIHSMKRLGRLLDEDGRSVGNVPIAAEAS